MIDLRKKGAEPVSGIAGRINLHKEPRPGSKTKSSDAEPPGAANPGKSGNQGGASRPQSGSHAKRDAWIGGYCGCLVLLALFSVCLRGGFWGLLLGIAVLLGLSWLGSRLAG